MRKIGSIVVAVAILATLVFAFSGCGEDKNVSSGSGASAANVGDVVFKSMGFEVYQPKGWSSMVDGTNTIITPPDYPTVGDTIKVTVSDKIKDFASCTEEYYKTTYGKAYTGFKLNSYTKTKVNSYEAVNINFSYTLNGKSLIQDQTVVDANSCYTFSFIDESRQNTAILENSKSTINVQ